MGAWRGEQWNSEDPKWSADVLSTKQNKKYRSEYQYLSLKLPSLCPPTAYLGCKERTKVPLENSKKATG